MKFIYILMAINVTLIYLMYLIARKKLLTDRIKYFHYSKYNYYPFLVLINLIVGYVILGQKIQPVNLLVEYFKWFTVISLILYFLAYFWKKRNQNLVAARNYYKIFKYIFTQLDTGANVHQTYKMIYRIADDAKLKQVLLQFSVMLSQNTQLTEAVRVLKKELKTDEGKVFCSIILNIGQNSMTSNGLIHVDQMLFQKYLSGIRAETKRIERHYIGLVILFTILVSMFLLLPLLAEMAISAQRFFQ